MGGSSWKGFVAGVAAVTIALTGLSAWTGLAAGEQSAFTPVNPCRLIDTRPSDRVGPLSTFGADSTRAITAAGQCGVPTGATGLSLNVTALGATAPTFVTIWGTGGRPTASSLNPSPGLPPAPNAVLTPLASSGSFLAYNLAGSVDLIIDVNGYFSDLSSNSGGGGGGGGTGVSAVITGYSPGFSITTVIGTATNNSGAEIDVRVDVRCPDNSVEIDFLFNMPAGSTLGWDVLCNGVFSSGASVTTVQI